MKNNQHEKSSIHLLILDPSHFHAALLQKHMYPEINPIVNVYAPKGPDLDAHLKLIKNFNKRSNNPTNWDERVYTGPDYLQKMLHDKAGNVVIISGDSSHKMNYILSSVEAGFNVLADKPMAITRDDFKILLRVFELTEEKKVLLYDIMSERYDVTNIIQRELAQAPEIFGALEIGSPEEPAVIIESVHQLHKKVDGQTLIRPDWFFDTRHQGGAIADVGTHLVVLVQWMCFPDQIIDWRNEVRIISSKRWPTRLTLDQFKVITGLSEFPNQLEEYVTPDNCLMADKNGEVVYTLRGIHILVRTLWNFEAEPDANDTQISMMRGSKANLTVLQDVEQKGRRVLYVEKKIPVPNDEFEKSLRASFSSLPELSPGLEVKARGNILEIIVPKEAMTDHEDHFSQVTKRYINYLAESRLPEWEVPGMIAKYYVTTEANDASQSTA
jgi:predicted dehydrogenase